MKTRRNLLWIVLVASASGLACVASYPGGPYGDPGQPSPRDGRYGYSNERFAALAHELDERAARAHQIVEGLSARNGPREREFFERIHHFSNQARAFHQRYESGEINSRGRLRGEIDHLLEDARATDDAIRQARVFPEVWNEWQSVVRVLQRMLEVVGTENRR